MEVALVLRQNLPPNVDPKIGQKEDNHETTQFHRRCLEEGAEEPEVDHTL
jgi:hypothetical protein